MDKGKLYICGTPLGNLDDITFRALDTLKKVDLIAAEDTRRTEKLLNYFDINTKLTSYHEHNEDKKAPELISMLEQRKNIALVSDAGMPGISDPGKIIIDLAIKEGIEIIPIPGPTAVISALVVSGLPMDRFVFEGFLPRKGEEREKSLAKVREEERTIIFYESPYRLKDTLEDLIRILNDRKVAVIREISKIHEEKIYGTAEQVLDQFSDREVKGEIVIVVQGRETSSLEQEGWEELSIVDHVELLMKNGYTKKKAIKKVARVRGLPKKKVYKKAIAIEARKFMK